jgi:two-component system, NtrC family, sensor kinase
MPINKNQEEFKILSHQILDISNKGLTRVDFLQEISKKLLEISNSDTVELFLDENENYVHTWMSSDEIFSFQYEVIAKNGNLNGYDTNDNRFNYSLKQFHKLIIGQKINLSQIGFTKKGSFIGECDLRTLKYITDDNRTEYSIDLTDNTIAIFTINFGNKIIGTIQFSIKENSNFKKEKLELFEETAENLGIAIFNQRTQAALHERVKELSCLYRITQVAETEFSSIEDILISVVETLPPAWQYPEITTAKIIYNGQVFISKNYRAGWQKQIAEITIQGKKKGFIEVSYIEIKPYLDEGPFLREERHLIDAIANQLALIIERKEIQLERLELQDQLRHADRLAIIGQLAAGVAHELNEPLGSILGFAQLIKKDSGCSEQSDKDIDKIIKASLHAREIIRKLLVFAREMNSKICPVNLNQIIENGLYFLESRCQKSGVEIIRNLDDLLPAITGDESQLHQVLVNLVVNSIQAMPDGGKLTIQTYCAIDNVYMVVEDNGIGMDEDVKSKIFIPFFTTKDVNEGTGLGLAVVHGIITSHKGRIKVDSSPGKGTRFEVRLPIG